MKGEATRRRNVKRKAAQAIVVGAVILLPVTSIAASSDSHCESWSLDGHRLGMSLGALRSLHPDLVYLGMYGTDGHRTQVVGEGAWYRWESADGRLQSFARTARHDASSPIVALTLVRNFYGWSDRDLRRVIDALSAKLGAPAAPHMSLKSTAYAEVHGTPKTMRKWNATTWESADCDVRVTAMYAHSRDERGDRVTLFHIATTRVSSHSDDAFGAPRQMTIDERPCNRWKIGANRLALTAAQARAIGRSKPRRDGWHALNQVDVCADVSGAEPVAVRVVYPEEHGWSARRGIELLIDLWGPPAEDNVDVRTTQYFRAFGFPYGSRKKWRATVWEDERCDLVATAFYVEFKQWSESVMLFDMRRYPVTRFVVVLHRRSRVADLERAPGLCLAPDYL